MDIVRELAEHLTRATDDARTAMIPNLHWLIQRIGERSSRALDFEVETSLAASVVYNICCNFDPGWHAAKSISSPTLVLSLAHSIGLVATAKLEPHFLLLEIWSNSCRYYNVYDHSDQLISLQ